MFGRPILCPILLKGRAPLPSTPVLPSSLLLPNFRLLLRALRWLLSASLLRWLSLLLLLCLLSPLRLGWLWLRLLRVRLRRLNMLLRWRLLLLSAPGFCLLRLRSLLGTLRSALFLFFIPTAFMLREDG
jgi:hypothetical protein